MKNLSSLTLVCLIVFFAVNSPVSANWLEAKDDYKYGIPQESRTVFSGGLIV
jgi:hypothetical protein